MRALVLLLAPLLCSGCAVWEADFEPVFVTALWEGAGSSSLDVPGSVFVPGPLPQGLERAARTGDGVWHVELRYSDGSVRHRVWEPGHPGLRAGDGMERWASPDVQPAGSAFVPAREPWPAAALPLQVLGAPGASPTGFVDPPEPTPGQAAARELFAGLDEPWGEGEGSLLRLSTDRQAIEVARPDGAWLSLARIPAEGHWVHQPPRRGGGSRAAGGIFKAILTPPAVALDAGWLATLGALKVVTVVAAVPVVGAAILCMGW